LLFESRNAGFPAELTPKLFWIAGELKQEQAIIEALPGEIEPCVKG
jgi:hypothetical protein